MTITRTDVDERAPILTSVEPSAFRPRLSNRDRSVRQCFHVAGIVRHVNRGELQLSPQRRQLLPQGYAQIGVEARKWFVEEQQPRRTDERASERGTLLLPAGELMWIAIGQRRLEPGELQHLDDSSRAVGFREAGRIGNELEISSHREVRPQREILEHETDSALVGRHDVASRLRDFPAVEPDLAAVRTLQPGDQTQQRGFS